MAFDYEPETVAIMDGYIEKAAKYGDGHIIEITAFEEEGCKLISVRNSRSIKE